MEETEQPTVQNRTSTQGEHNQRNNSNDTGYDKLSHKIDKVLRIGFININGIPAKSDNPKNKMIFEAIRKYEIDITGMVETNIQWNKVRMKDQWRE